MKNTQKQTREAAKNPKQQIKPAAEKLSETELDKVAGGASYSTSRSNIRGLKLTD